MIFLKKIILRLNRLQIMELFKLWPVPFYRWIKFKYAKLDICKMEAKPKCRRHLYFIHTTCFPSHGTFTVFVFWLWRTTWYHLGVKYFCMLKQWKDLHHFISCCHGNMRACASLLTLKTKKWAQCHGPIILSLESYKEQKPEAIRDVIWPSCWNGRQCSKEYDEDYLSKILNIDHLINTQNRKKEKDSNRDRERKMETETERGTRKTEKRLEKYLENFVFHKFWIRIWILDFNCVTD